MGYALPSVARRDPKSNRDDPARVIAALSEQQAALELSSIDLCFAAALYLQAEGAGLTSFSEERLVTVFEEVCAVLEPQAEQVRARATHAVRRLRQQRLLARVDGSGVVRAGEFALSRLGAGIVEFYLEEDVLTRESLTLLLRTLLDTLLRVRGEATKATDGRAWRERVVAPLRVTVRDLADGIERRQRGFDHQQEAFQREIGQLLATDWFDAIDRCQALLESTASNLRELNNILLRDTHELQSVLHDIVELALDAGEEDPERAAQRVVDQVDRFTAWGAARQEAWSEYYEYVHRYLRDVVRLDPTRALSQRLREQIANYPRRPFALLVAEAPALRVLRELKPGRSGPPVRRQREDREPELEAVDPDDAFKLVEQRVLLELERGTRDLGTLTALVTADLPPDERFLVAGRIAQVVARCTHPVVRAERPWVVVDETLCIEQWRLDRRAAG